MALESWLDDFWMKGAVAFTPIVLTAFFVGRAYLNLRKQKQEGKQEGRQEYLYCASSAAGDYFVPLEEKKPKSQLPSHLSQR